VVLNEQIQIAVNVGCRHIERRKITTLGNSARLTAIKSAKSRS
jgi:hypothetical protein